jgi:hypothetical protein
VDATSGDVRVRSLPLAACLAGVRISTRVVLSELLVVCLENSGKPPVETGGSRLSGYDAR